MSIIRGVFNEEVSLYCNFVLIKHSIFRWEVAVTGVTRNRWCKTQSVSHSRARQEVILCAMVGTLETLSQKKTV
jgi:hypothetical protein